MRRLFIPVKENNYHAWLLRKPMMALYLLLLFVFNIVFGSASLIFSSAAVDFNTLYTMHNQERLNRGLTELSINQKLIASATAKAQAMLASDCWSHYCPNGKSPWEFFDSANYSYIYAGENLAEGFADNDAVMNAWMNSPTHRENIINPKFDEIGIGFASGTYQNIQNNTIIVVHFGTTAESIKNPNVITPSPQQTVAPSQTLNKNITLLPLDNAYQKSGNTFEIKGTAENIDQVELKANDNSLGKVSVSGGLFTYRPSAQQLLEEKDYNLQGVSGSNDALIKSNIIKVTIDRTAPKLTLNNVQIETGADTLSIYIKDSDADAITLNNGAKNFTLGSGNSWSITLSKAEAEVYLNFSILAKDKAGNETSLELRNPFGEQATKSGQIAIVSQPTPYNFPQLFKNQASVVNFTFLIFMSGLFGMDYVMLKKTGMTGTNRSQSHLNFVIFIGLAFLVLLGSASGDILNGINL